MPSVHSLPAHTDEGAYASFGSGDNKGGAGRSGRRMKGAEGRRVATKGAIASVRALARRIAAADSGANRNNRRQAAAYAERLAQTTGRKPTNREVALIRASLRDFVRANG